MNIPVFVLLYSLLGKTVELGFPRDKKFLADFSDYYYPINDLINVNSRNKHGEKFYGNCNNLSGSFCPAVNFATIEEVLYYGLPDVSEITESIRLQLIDQRPKKIYLKEETVEFPIDRRVKIVIDNDEFTLTNDIDSWNELVRTLDASALTALLVNSEFEPNFKIKNSTISKCADTAELIDIYENSELSRQKHYNTFNPKYFTKFTNNNFDSFPNLDQVSSQNRDKNQTECLLVNKNIQPELDIYRLQPYKTLYQIDQNNFYSIADIEKKLGFPYSKSINPAKIEINQNDYTKELQLAELGYKLATNEERLNFLNANNILQDPPEKTFVGLLKLVNSQLKKILGNSSVSRVLSEYLPNSDKPIFNITSISSEEPRFVKYKPVKFIWEYLYQNLFLTPLRTYLSIKQIFKSLVGKNLELIDINKNKKMQQTFQNFYSSNTQNAPKKLSVINGFKYEPFYFTFTPVDENSNELADRNVKHKLRDSNIYVEFYGKWTKSAKLLSDVGVLRFSEPVSVFEIEFDEILNSKKDDIIVSLLFDSIIGLPEPVFPLVKPVLSFFNENKESDLTSILRETSLKASSKLDKTSSSSILDILSVYDNSDSVNSRKSEILYDCLESLFFDTNKSCSFLLSILDLNLKNEKKNVTLPFFERIDTIIVRRKNKTAILNNTKTATPLVGIKKIAFGSSKLAPILNENNINFLRQIDPTVSRENIIASQIKQKFSEMYENSSLGIDAKLGKIIINTNMTKPEASDKILNLRLGYNPYETSLKDVIQQNQEVLSLNEWPYSLTKFIFSHSIKEAIENPNFTAETPFDAYLNKHGKQIAEKTLLTIYPVYPESRLISFPDALKQGYTSKYLLNPFMKDEDTIFLVPYTGVGKSHTVLDH